MKDFNTYHEAFWTPAFKDLPKDNVYKLVQSICCKI